MEKAFDLKDLEARLMAKGMPHVPGLAKDMVVEVFGWVEESVKLTETKLDDIGLPIVNMVRDYILGKIEKLAE